MEHSKLTKAVISLTLILFACVHSISAQSKKEPVSQLLYKIIQEQGYEVAIQHYKYLKSTAPQQYDLGENQLNRLGYQLLNENKTNDALSIFKFNAETNPESINVWDSLGEGYLKIGEYERAGKNFRKVLKMLVDDTTLAAQQKNFLKNGAQAKLFKAEHFDPPSQETFHYVSSYG